MSYLHFLMACISYKREKDVSEMYHQKPNIVLVYHIGQRRVILNKVRYQVTIAPAIHYVCK